MGLLSRFFGKNKVVERSAEPDLVYIPNEDERMNWAMEKAGLTLWYFENSLKSPSAGQEYFSIKVMIEDEGQVEHIWLTAPDFDEEGNLFGEVGNEPVQVKNVKLGQKIGVMRTLISDWMIVEHGRLIGGYTIRAIREGIPETERTSFDESIGLLIDVGIDHFKADFDTPEGAILSLEQAYQEKDIDKALACKDFYQEAKLMLSSLDFQMEEEMIISTSEALAISFVSYIEKEGMPDFSNINRAFTNREKINDNYWIITEVCTYPDGGNSVQRLQTYKTAQGWRVLGVAG
ncbi:YegJ family protein [Pedobacter caeni]|uniref:DUF2314 domain-containing protein n=1 Tax=Pedobacter caeni TaxID=288992 RepID=A0A1M4VKK5_9SPHI|nr:DUF2314 domain-containing protein [Pedobacter caeni]SHE69410.1 hypothetical protein SAMN04488522_101936 [Pedobacter caeni]